MPGGYSRSYRDCGIILEISDCMTVVWHQVGFPTLICLLQHCLMYFRTIANDSRFEMTTGASASSHNSCKNLLCNNLPSLSNDTIDPLNNKMRYRRVKELPL